MKADEDEKLYFVKPDNESIVYLTNEFKKDIAVWFYELEKQPHIKYPPDDIQ